MFKACFYDKKNEACEVFIRAAPRERPWQFIALITKIVQRVKRKCIEKEVQSGLKIYFADHAYYRRNFKETLQRKLLARPTPSLNLTHKLLGW